MVASLLYKLTNLLHSSGLSICKTWYLFTQIAFLKSVKISLKRHSNLHVTLSHTWPVSFHFLHSIQAERWERLEIIVKTLQISGGGFNKNFIPQNSSDFQLLAPQSSALRRGAYRDFHTHTHPIHPLIAFEHFSLYIQKHWGVVTTNSKLNQ